MPTIPSTVEIPIGKFVQYVALLIFLGVIVGVVISIVGFKTSWLRNLAQTLFHFFILENPVVPIISVGSLAAYLLVKRRFGHKRIETK